MAGAGMPLLEAPETTESAEPSGRAGASTPGTGTLAGASIASLGTVVPSGREVRLSAALFAVAVALTRLAVHTPDSNASGTRVNAWLLRDNGLVVMYPHSPLILERVAAPLSRATFPVTKLPRGRHLQTSRVPAMPQPSAYREDLASPLCQAVPPEVTSHFSSHSTETTCRP